MTASQCSISASDPGLRDWRIGDGSSTMDLSSWRRRLVEGGVGEREVAMVVRAERSFPQFSLHVAWILCNTEG